MPSSKFRVWDNKKKKWLRDTDSSCICIGLDGEVSKFSYMFETFDILRDVIFTQYTGLHDMNNEYIWEDDIVQCDFSFYDSNGKRDRETSVGVIKLEDGEFCLKTGYHTIHSHDLSLGFKTDRLRDGARAEWTEFKKIGNVFENPDLIQR